MAEKSESEGDEERQRLADRVLGRLEDAVYWGIAVVLIIGSVALLVAQFNTMLTLRSAPAKAVTLEVLDGLLLIFIFVELLYAVRACLRSHEIVAEPFLIVGILAGQRNRGALGGSRDAPGEGPGLLPRGRGDRRSRRRRPGIGSFSLRAA